MDPYTFSTEVFDWIRSTPLTKWYPKTAKYGDNFLQDDDYLLIQKSRRGMEKALTIQAIGIRQDYGRLGYTKKFLMDIENTAREHGVDVIVIQSIINTRMIRLAEGLGYTLSPYSMACYEKRLK